MLIGNTSHTSTHNIACPCDFYGVKKKKKKSIRIDNIIQLYGDRNPHFAHGAKRNVYWFKYDVCFFFLSFL